MIRFDVQIARSASSDDPLTEKNWKETKEAGVQVDLGWPTALDEHSGLETANKAGCQSFPDLSATVNIRELSDFCRAVYADVLVKATTCYSGSLSGRFIRN
jgi:hypothetical protein